MAKGDFKYLEALDMYLTSGSQYTKFHDAMTWLKNNINTDNYNDELKPNKYLIGEKFSIETDITNALNDIETTIQKIEEEKKKILEADKGGSGKRKKDNGSSAVLPPVVTVVTPDTPTEDLPIIEDPTPDTAPLPTIPDSNENNNEFIYEEEENPTTNASKGTLNITQENVNIIDENGNIIDTATIGQYKVYETKTDNLGRVIAVRISPDGEPEQWIFLEQNGTKIGSYYVEGQVGTYFYDGAGLPIYDATGNIIGVLSGGEYRIYATEVDINGNITAIRISPDGETEQWLHIFEDGKYIGEFEQNGIIYSNQNITMEDPDNNKLTLFSTKNMVLGGILGVLVVALGTTMYIKNKQGKTMEEEVPEGEYNIYEYNQDDDGNITEARITDDTVPEGEEQWVQF